MPPRWVAQLFGDLDSYVRAAVKIALKPLEQHMEKLDWEIKKFQ